MQPIPSPVPGPDEVVALHELRAAITRALESLTPREALIIRRYYGFEGDGCTYDELGTQLGVSGTRVRQVLDAALSKLRHLPRRQILRPHVVLSLTTERAERTARETGVMRVVAEATRVADEMAERITTVTRQAEERREREALRLRLGDEVGSTLATAWRGDSRRSAIAAFLDRTVKNVITEVHTSNEVYAYIRAHLDNAWQIYEAWKRDVRRGLLNSRVTFTRSITVEGDYLVSVRSDQCTWYLFEEGHGPYSRGHRWVGYMRAVQTSARRGHLKALEQSMLLVISCPSLTE